jgi:hypothetical protein
MLIITRNASVYIVKINPVSYTIDKLSEDDLENVVT